MFQCSGTATCLHNNAFLGVHPTDVYFLIHKMRILVVYVNIVYCLMV